MWTPGAFANGSFVNFDMKDGLSGTVTAPPPAYAVGVGHATCPCIRRASLPSKRHRRTRSDFGFYGFRQNYPGQPPANFRL